MTDIRKGDLVKATRKDDPDSTGSGRVVSVSLTSVVTGQFYFPFASWDIEVLDRPLPPIGKELLEGAINAWRKGYYGFGPERDVALSKDYREGATAVINFVREYDRTNNKENNK